MKELENDLSTALVNLLTISISGPAVVPMGRAIEAVNAALEKVRGTEQETEGAQREEPCGAEVCQ